MPRLSTQLILILAIVILGAVIVFAGPAACNKIRSMGAQSRVDSSQSSAASNSAADAINTVQASGARETASEDLTRQNEANIRAANGATDKVNPAVRDAGIAALCQRAAYRNDPRCKGARP